MTSLNSLTVETTAEGKTRAAEIDGSSSRSSLASWRRNWRGIAFQAAYPSGGTSANCGCQGTHICHIRKRSWRCLGVWRISMTDFMYHHKCTKLCYCTESQPETQLQPIICMAMGLVSFAAVTSYVAADIIYQLSSSESCAFCLYFCICWDACCARPRLEALPPCTMLEVSTSSPDNPLTISGAESESCNEEQWILEVRTRETAYSH